MMLVVSDRRRGKARGYIRESCEKQDADARREGEARRGSGHCDGSEPEGQAARDIPPGSREEQGQICSGEFRVCKCVCVFVIGSWW